LHTGIKPPLPAGLIAAGRIDKEKKIMDRAEHLIWCKQRALEYVEADDLAGAMASMFSDLNKHPETANHAAIQLGTMLLITGNLSTPRQVREFIEGFN
jgi:hypothetical protein